MPESQVAATTDARYQNILFDTDGQIATVKLNRPLHRQSSRRCKASLPRPDRRREAARLVSGR